MQHKLIVICGPEVDADNALFYAKHRALKEVVQQFGATYLMFPEGHNGAQAVRERIRNLDKEHRDASKPLVVVTRHECGLYGAIATVLEDNAPRENVEFHLFHDKAGSQVTIHQLDSQGHLANDWPIGVLW